jgi:hypothetical protein
MTPWVRKKIVSNTTYSISKRTDKVTDHRDALAGQCAYNLGRPGARLIWTAFFATFPETLAATAGAAVGPETP